MSTLGQRFVAELIGTFIFLGVIIHVVNKNEQDGWIKVGLALSVAVLLVGNVSGGHFNPATTIMMYAAGKLSRSDLIPYLIVQIAGGLVALELYKRFKF